MLHAHVRRDGAGREHAVTKPGGKRQCAASANATRCISQRSALHRATQRAAQSIAVPLPTHARPAQDCLIEPSGLKLSGLLFVLYKINRTFATRQSPEDILLQYILNRYGNKKQPFFPNNSDGHGVPVHNPAGSLQGQYEAICDRCIAVLDGHLAI